MIWIDDFLDMGFINVGVVVGNYIQLKEEKVEK